MKVRDLIRILECCNLDHEVSAYTPEGDIQPVSEVIKDGSDSLNALRDGFQCYTGGQLFVMPECFGFDSLPKNVMEK